MSETRQIVVPGERIAAAGELRPGQNTYEEADGIYALRLGVKSVRGDRVNVIALSGRYEPARGDMVIGTVAEAGPSNWYINIGAANDVGMHVNDVPWRVEFGETKKYLDIGDSVLLKIVHVDELKKAQVSMKDRQCRKLTGGLLFEVSPAKVPRIVGRQGSMISMLKDATNVRVFVGQNGVIWLDGETEDVALALEALRKIEAEAHTSGLTDRMKAWLEERRPSAGRTHRPREEEEEPAEEEREEERPRREFRERPERPERRERRDERRDERPRMRRDEDEDRPRRPDERREGRREERPEGPRGRPESAKRRFQRDEEDEEDEGVHRPVRRVPRDEDEEERPARRPLRDEVPERPVRRRGDDERQERPERRERRDERRDERPRMRRDEDAEEERPARRPRFDDVQSERPVRRAPRDEDEDDAPRRREHRGGGGGGSHGGHGGHGGGHNGKRRGGRGGGGGGPGRSRRADDQED